MAQAPKNVPTDRSVEEVIAALEDEQTAADARTLVEIMQRVSGHEPRVWHVATIGFDSYHYRYDSGREGDAQAISFSPRKGKITVYLMDGTERYAELLAGLGKHTRSRVCLYLKRLSDIDLPVLEEILTRSYANVKAQDGDMKRVE
jgi:hypothetical protein